MRRLGLLSLVAACLVAAAGLTSACGESKASAETIVRAVPAKTEKAGTARLAMTITGEGSHSPTINTTATGVLDIHNKRGEIDLDVPNAGKLKALFFGTVMYMQLPAQAQQQLAGGKPFIRVDLNEVAKQQGLDLGALAQQNPDADSQMAILNGAGSDFKAIGHEQVRGTDTTHYKGTIDLAKAAQGATPEKQKVLTNLQQKLGTTTLPADVWVDGQGRLRKLTQTMDLGKIAAANGQAGQTGTMTSTFELFDYGVKVNVTEPAPDQFTDLTAVVGAAASGKAQSQSSQSSSATVSGKQP